MDIDRGMKYERVVDGAGVCEVINIRCDINGNQIEAFVSWQGGAWDILKIDDMTENFQPYVKPEEKDPEQPYLPEYRRSPILATTGLLYARDRIGNKLNLDEWMTNEMFAGFEYEDEIISSVPVRYRLGDVVLGCANASRAVEKDFEPLRPKWVLIKEGE